MAEDNGVAPSPHVGSAAPTARREEQTIAEMLHDAGYAYRPCHIEGKREVYRISDGRIEGIFAACEACDFIESLNPEPMLPFMEPAG